jgi:putative transposase
MPYWQLYYHVTWSTRNREPRIAPEVETCVLEAVRSKVAALGGTLFAANCVQDHVHLVVAIPPGIAVGTFVGQVKGLSSSRVNRAGLATPPFHWQDEYGAFSFDRRRLPGCLAYVAAQKEHHFAGTTIPVLERYDGDGGAVVREPAAIYVASDPVWREEMLAAGSL